MQDTVFDSIRSQTSLVEIWPGSNNITFSRVLYQNIEMNLTSNITGAFLGVQGTKSEYEVSLDSVVIENVTILGSRLYQLEGLIYSLASSLQLFNSLFTNIQIGTQASHYGPIYGAVLNAQYGSVRLINATFQNNTVYSIPDMHGGLVYTNGAPVTALKILVQNNAIICGNSVYGGLFFMGGTFLATQSIFSQNSVFAQTINGAILYFQTGQLADVFITCNVANVSMGGIIQGGGVYAGVSLSFSNTLIQGMTLNGINTTRISNAAYYSGNTPGGQPIISLNNMICCQDDTTVNISCPTERYCVPAYSMFNCVELRFTPTPSASPALSASPAPSDIPTSSPFVSLSASPSASVVPLPVHLVISGAFSSDISRPFALIARSTFDSTTEATTCLYQPLVSTYSNTTYLLPSDPSATLHLGNVSSIAFDGIEYSSTDGRPFSYSRYVSPLAPSVPETTVAITTVYSSERPVKVVLKRSNNAAFLTRAGVAKFAIAINCTAAGSRTLFGPTNGNINNQRLKWSFCASVAEQFGAYSVNYTSRYVPDRATVQYTFARNLSDMAISVSNVALIDGTERNITHDLSVSSSSEGTLSVCVVLSFPYFASTLLYDPDLSVLTDTADSTNTDQSGNDGNSVDIKTIVIPVVVGSVVVITCIVVVVLVAVAVYVRLRHQVLLHNHAKHVAFGDSSRSHQVVNLK
eukprot:TRINITY_DN3002_c0_g1_i8.p1 TRINITY_DN3002_c0_g1~~TRINITY_DN3002_c0_g1_i8.p1  ORF type:complete len:693 (-),score=44.03 TRINITY_DN3002_c0_g1_i8:18-2096(-)